MIPGNFKKILYSNRDQTYVGHMQDKCPIDYPLSLPLHCFLLSKLRGISQRTGIPWIPTKDNRSSLVVIYFCFPNSLYLNLKKIVLSTSEDNYLEYPFLC